MLPSETTIDLIQHTCVQAADSLHYVAKAGVEAVHFFHFDIGSLRDFAAEGTTIRATAEYKADFERLSTVKGPVVYVFEISSASNPADVLAAAKAYKDQGGLRAMPAFRRNILTTSPVLYVGKVKANFEGRVVQHLGFSPTAATQGLQLYHWTRGLDLELRLTAFEFKAEMAELLAVVEKALATQLHPLLGKHQ